MPIDFELPGQYTHYQTLLQKKRIIVLTSSNMSNTDNCFDFRLASRSNVEGGSLVDRSVGWTAHPVRIARDNWAGSRVG